MPQFISINELVTATRLSLPTVYRKIKSKEIPSTRMGKRILIPASFLKELEEKAISTSSKTEV
jgi:excisionase family DNA binding protein